MSRENDNPLAYGDYYEREPGERPGENEDGTRGIIGDTFKILKQTYKSHHEQNYSDQPGFYGAPQSSNPAYTSGYGPQPPQAYAQPGRPHQYHGQPEYSGGRISSPGYQGGLSQARPQKQDKISGFLGKLQDAFVDFSSEAAQRLGTAIDPQGYAQYGSAKPTSRNRLGSFAPPRDGNDVKWYVDGCNYFYAVSKALESAKESIWILDWWLSPELYLRRPPAKNQQYRLDRMLLAAAERGVRVNVIVYKEVTQALTLSSVHTKHSLEALHPNIAVFRHPDHVPDSRVLVSSILSPLEHLTLDTKAINKMSERDLKGLYGMDDEVVLYWAHHEKLCIIDGKTSFMGGLDLCFGRWDTHQHAIADVHPTNLDEIVYPGQDYNNARVLDFHDVAHWEQNQLNRTVTSRMGWSDVSVSLHGPVVEDLRRHFVERWNFIFDIKYHTRTDRRYTTLSLYGNQPGHHHHFSLSQQSPMGSQQSPVSAYQQCPSPSSQQQPTAAFQAQTTAGYPPPPPTQAVSDEHSGGEHAHSSFSSTPPPPPPMAASAYQAYHPPNNQAPYFPPPPTQESYSTSQAPYFPPPPTQEAYYGRRREVDADEDDESNEDDQERGSGTEQRRFRRDVTDYGGVIRGQLAGQIHHYQDRMVSHERQRSSRGNMECQILRSCSKWSHGVPTEHSIADAYAAIIRNSEHYVYIENQFFITATGDSQKPVTNKIGAAIVERVLRAARAGEKYHIMVVMPSVPAFAGDLRDDAALGTRAIMDFQYRSINRGNNSIMELIAKEGFNPMNYIRFYNLRNYDRISVDQQMLAVEQRSGVSYEDARRAHDFQNVGQGGYGPEATGAGVERDPGAPYYQQYQQAAQHVYHSNKPSASGRWDSVSECYMLNGEDIRNVPWEGSPESEIDAFVSEELYVHSKVMIADDRVVICGSANLNDRSQRGDHDSELAILVEDTTPVQSLMNGQPWTASRFAASLRRELCRKHLGLLPAQDYTRCDANSDPVGVPNLADFDSPESRVVADPLSDTFQSLWNSRARTNTEVFRKVFHTVPDDNVRNWATYREFYEYYFHGTEKEAESKPVNGKGARYKYGHVVRENFPPGPEGVRQVKELLSQVKGTLIEMPLMFLIEENIAKEGLSLNELTEPIYT